MSSLLLVLRDLYIKSLELAVGIDHCWNGAQALEMNLPKKNESPLTLLKRMALSTALALVNGKK